MTSILIVREPVRKKNKSTFAEPPSKGRGFLKGEEASGPKGQDWEWESETVKRKPELQTGWLREALRWGGDFPKRTKRSTLKKVRSGWRNRLGH